MTSKEYLLQIQLLKTFIETRQEQLEELKAQATSLRSPSADEKVQTSKVVGDIDAERIAKYVDLEKKIEHHIECYMELKDQIISEIEELRDERYIKLLKLRYIDGKTFEVIACEMRYNWRHIIRLHGDALQSFNNIVLSKKDSIE